MIFADNKRYHTLNHYYQQTFGEKVFKVSLNGGFTCPNIDGTVGIGGCIFCSSKGSGDFAGNAGDDLLEQFNQTKSTLHKKWPEGKYIPYFQANTNTYAPVEKLEKIYNEVLNFDDVVGLSLATRPDAISDDALNLLDKLSKQTYLTVELGLQSIHDETLKLINRGHDFACFHAMQAKLRERKINVVVHIINGLPYESKEMMLETAAYLHKINPHGVKIHMLHILKNTALYEQEKFHLLSREEYVDIVCDQLEMLRNTTVIHRITGDADFSQLIQPEWIKKKFCVMNEIDKELRKRRTYQGFRTNILNKARQLLEINMDKNDLVIDATIGNGNDTLFLCNLAHRGHVFGFDIQQIAIEKTDALLQENNKSNYTLHHASHDLMSDYLAEYSGKISAAIFNLGYLPNGDKSITTKTETTIKAIKSALSLLKENGIILIVAYPHEEGKSEAAEIMKLAENGVKIETFRNTEHENSPHLIVLRVKSK